MGEDYSKKIQELNKGDVLKYLSNVRGTTRSVDHFLVFHSYKDCKVYGSIGNIGRWDGLSLDGLLRSNFKIYSWKSQKFIKQPTELTKESIYNLIKSLNPGDVIGYSFEEKNNISTLVFDSLEGNSMIKGTILKCRPDSDKSIFDFKSLNFQICKWSD